MQPGNWFFLPQRGYLSSLFLPRPKHLPPDADLRVIGFNFSPAGPFGASVGPLATAYQTVQIAPAFNWWGLGLIDSLQAPQGFQVQAWHLSVNGQRQLFNISSPSVIAGSGGPPGYPMFLPETELFLSGDSIRVQVKNLSTTASDNIWLAFWGGDVQEA